MSNFLNLEITVPYKYMDALKVLLDTKLEKDIETITITKPRDGYFTYTCDLTVKGCLRYGKLIWYIVNYFTFLAKSDFDVIIQGLKVYVPLPQINSQLTVGFYIGLYERLPQLLVLKGYKWNVDLDHVKLFKELQQSDSFGDWVKYTGEITTLS